MKIVIAHSFYRVPGGEDAYVEQLTRLLGKTDEPVLLSLRNSDLRSTLEAGRRMLFSPSMVRRVKQQIAAIEPDIVHVHNTYPAFGPAIHLAARDAGIPLVMTVHNHRLRCPNGYMFTEGHVCRRCQNGAYFNAVLHDCFDSRNQAVAYAIGTWAHRFALKLEERVSCFIAPSLYMTARLEEWGIPTSRIATVRNFTTQRPRATRRGQGAYLGRLSPEKGLMVLLEALRRLGDPPFRIIGDGPHRPLLEERARSLGLRRSKFCGRRVGAELLALMDDTSFLVMPSLCEENSPLALYEAMAMSIPVVVSGIGGLPELVRTGGGIAFAPGDAAALAKAIANMGDEGKYGRRAHAAGEFAQRELTEDAHIARLKSVYERVVN